MNDALYSDLALEQTMKERFGFIADIDSVIARGVQIGPTGEATVFLTKKKQLMVFIMGQSRYTLGDIQKIISRMGFKAELYLSPKQQPDYFDTIAFGKFREVFPGRSTASDDDLRFYRTLAPYNPALVLIAEVKNGEIRQYDSDARGGWRVAAKFAYRRIKTS